MAKYPDLPPPPFNTLIPYDFSFEPFRGAVKFYDEKEFVSVEVGDRGGDFLASWPTELDAVDALTVVLGREQTFDRGRLLLEDGHADKFKLPALDVNDVKERVIRNMSRTIIFQLSNVAMHVTWRRPAKHFDFTDIEIAEMQLWSNINLGLATRPVLDGFIGATALPTLLADREAVLNQFAEYVPRLRVL